MKYSDNESYYGELMDGGVISRTRALLENYGYHIKNDKDGDGKIYCELHMAWDYPWHHVKHTDEVDCHTWHRVMFDIVGLLPSRCLDCFKIVVKPQTVKQLFALLDLQIRLGLPSKCGIEDRKEVFGNYGGYFYTRSLEKGLETYMEVYNAIKEDPILSPLLDVLDDKSGLPKLCILKRGCTEFERKFGRSDKWTVTGKQIALEEKINKAFYRDYPAELQTQDIIEFVHQKWLEFAWDRGDPTVMEFNRGFPLHLPYVVYHHMCLRKEGEKSDNT